VQEALLSPIIRSRKPRSGGGFLGTLVSKPLQALGFGVEFSGNGKGLFGRA
jgi:hypothetical protein